MVTVYRIFDAKDPNYEPWYGDQDDIVQHLQEAYERCIHDNDSSWVQALEDYGLTFEVVYDKEAN